LLAQKINSGKAAFTLSDFFGFKMVTVFDVREISDPIDKLIETGYTVNRETIYYDR